MKSWVATVEADHTVRVPVELATGEQVLIVRVPSIADLLNDRKRRGRFSATRAAIQSALQFGVPQESLSNQQVVNLVKEARRASQEE